MTKSQAIELVLLLRASYQIGGKVSEETAQVYESMILDLDFELTKAAVGRLIQTSKFFPAIAEIREAVRVTASGPKRSGIEAWGDVVHAVRYTGAYRTPVFGDPLVEHVVACIGWREVCLGDNEASLRARFVEAYESARDRGASEAALSASLRLQGQVLRTLTCPEPKEAPAGSLRGGASIGELVQGAGCDEALVLDEQSRSA